MPSVLQALPGALAPLLGVRPALLCTRGAEAQETAGGRDRPCPAARELSWHELPVYRGLLDLTVGANLGASLLVLQGLCPSPGPSLGELTHPRPGLFQGRFWGEGGPACPLLLLGLCPPLWSVCSKRMAFGWFPGQESPSGHSFSVWLSLFCRAALALPMGGWSWPLAVPHGPTA